MNPRRRTRRFHSGALLAVLAIVLGLTALSWNLVRPADEHLLQALVQGDAATARSLVEQGAWADARVEEGEHRGKTALMLAVQTGDVALVEQLLRAGASVEHDNGRGGTALMYAATSGDPAIVARLLEAGADLDRQAANGWTALMLATVKGHRQVVAQLADAGADLDRADVYGWTPLMRAAEQADAATGALLLELGADPARRNDQGLSAADIAAALTVQHGDGPAGSQAAPDLLESGVR